ncbi:molybdopterin molybdotransferase MoeA [Nocardioides sp. SYSU DS0651]|uniref:molybdopterin molybdotransferase MoeA n=1 Tax=Nocardioides sp. SYSU DS0651 TaxID=3415955 RepID=UPI003F4C497C
MAESRTTVADHLDRVLALVAPLGAVELPLADAAGRVLAEDVCAAVAVPPFDHAAMDGFAVRAADVASASASTPVRLPVVGTVAAGDDVVPLPTGAAIRIMTGAPVPPGSDLVVPFEWTSGADPVEVRRTAPDGRHIRRRGEDVAAGALALAAGSRLGPPQLGLLASVGRSTAAVRPRPRVAVVSTGAELVSGQVADSNSVTLAAAARRAGADARVHGPVPDDPPAFRDALLRAADDADLVVTTGGISAGDHDVVKAALREVDGFWFGPVAMKPGRPQGVGSVAAAGSRTVPVVTLPGTPVAAYCSFLLFCLPALRVLAGLTPRTARCAPLAAPVAGTDRTVLLPGAYDADGRVAPLPGHAGHSQRLLAEADLLLVVPPSSRLMAAGEIVEVLLLDPEEN